jgi:uncharacterized protein YlxP (DUF503 family)
MKAAALRFELHIPGSESLKEKRAVLRPLIERLRRQLSVSVSEVDYQDTWQRVGLGVAVVAPDGGRLDTLIERIRRLVGENLEVEVCEVAVYYLEEPHTERCPMSEPVHE